MHNIETGYVFFHLPDIFTLLLLVKRHSQLVNTVKILVENDLKALRYNKRNIGTIQSYVVSIVKEVSIIFHMTVHIAQVSLNRHPVFILASLSLTAFASAQITFD